MPAEGTGSPRAGTAAGRRPVALPDRTPGNTPRWHPRVAHSWDSIERLPFGRERGADVEYLFSDGPAGVGNRARTRRGLRSVIDYDTDIYIATRYRLL